MRFNPASSFEHALNKCYIPLGFLVFAFVWMFTCHFYNGLVSGNIL